MNERSLNERPLFTRSYAAALRLVAKGFDPLGAELSRNGSGGLLFRFPTSAQPALTEFHEAKDRLNVMSFVARGR